MKKNYIAPILRYCVISESAMLCTSGDGLQLINTEDIYATTGGMGGDEGTDNYVKAQNIWDMEW